MWIGDVSLARKCLCLHNFISFFLPCVFVLLFINRERIIIKRHNNGDFMIMLDIEIVDQLEWCFDSPVRASSSSRVAERTFHRTDICTSWIWTCSYPCAPSWAAPQHPLHYSPFRMCCCSTMESWWMCATSRVLRKHIYYIFFLLSRFLEGFWQQSTNHPANWQRIGKINLSSSNANDNKLLS